MLYTLFIQVTMGVEDGEEPLELELQVVMSSPMWLLRTKPGSVFNCQDSSGAPSALFLVVFVWLWLWFEFEGQSLIMWFGPA